MHDKQLLVALTVSLSFIYVGSFRLLNLDELIGVVTGATAYAYVTIGRHRESCEQLQETVDLLFSTIAFIIYGMLIPWSKWANLIGAGRGCFLAVGILFFRRLPWVMLARPILKPQIRTNLEAAFVGWFGPIGIGAIFYAAYAVEQTGDEDIYAIVSLIVFVSILAFGITDTVFTRLYGILEPEIRKRSTKKHSEKEEDIEELERIREDRDRARRLIRNLVKDRSSEDLTSLQQMFPLAISQKVPPENETPMDGNNIDPDSLNNFLHHTQAMHSTYSDTNSDSSRSPSRTNSLRRNFIPQLPLGMTQEITLPSLRELIPPIVEAIDDDAPDPGKSIEMQNMHHPMGVTRELTQHLPFFTREHTQNQLVGTREMHQVHSGSRKESFTREASPSLRDTREIHPISVTKEHLPPPGQSGHHTPTNVPHESTQTQTQTQSHLGAMREVHPLNVTREQIGYHTPTSSVTRELPQSQLAAQLANLSATREIQHHLNLTRDVSMHPYALSTDSREPTLPSLRDLIPPLPRHDSCDSLGALEEGQGHSHQSSHPNPSPGSSIPQVFPFLSRPSHVDLTSFFHISRSKHGSEVDLASLSSSTPPSPRSAVSKSRNPSHADLSAFEAHHTHEREKDREASHPPSLHSSHHIPPPSFPRSPSHHRVQMPPSKLSSENAYTTLPSESNEEEDINTRNSLSLSESVSVSEIIENTNTTTDIKEEEEEEGGQREREKGVEREEGMKISPTPGLVHQAIASPTIPSPINDREGHQRLREEGEEPLL